MNDAEAEIILGVILIALALPLLWFLWKYVFLGVTKLVIILCLIGTAFYAATVLTRETPLDPNEDMTIFQRLGGANMPLDELPPDGPTEADIVGEELATLGDWVDGFVESFSDWRKLVEKVSWLLDGPPEEPQAPPAPAGENEA